MPQSSIPPLTMFRSFLTVGSGYISQLMLLAVVMVSVGSSFFPEYVAFSVLDQEAQRQVMEDDPWKAITPLMFVAVVVLTSLGAIGIGWLVFKTAPFAQFSHAIFLAVLVFINYLQLVISDPPGKKTMTLAFMVFFPIAIVIGARIARGRMIPDEPETLT